MKSLNGIQAVVTGGASGILTIARGEGLAGPAIAITGNSGLEAMG